MRSEIERADDSIKKITQAIRTQIYAKCNCYHYGCAINISTNIHKITTSNQNRQRLEKKLSSRSQDTST